MPTALILVATVAGAVVVGLLCGLSALIFVQTVVALSARREARSPETGALRPRLAVLVPAHDEATGITATLESLLPQLASGDRLVVIADNCTDETATVARASGATVIERTDHVRRGKGFALDHGIQFLASDPPDVVLMFDADCVAGIDCVETLAGEAERLRRPIQARYLIRAANASIVSRVGEFAQRMRNWVRPSGMLRLGLPCQLMGSGMAFHWTLLQQQSVASGHLTEDLQLGLAFARQRRYPSYCPAAIVDSQAVSDPDSAVVQRTRWEHGHLGTIIGEWPKLAWLSVRRLDVRLASMAWDLAVPPLALFSSCVLLAGFVALVIGLAGGPWWPTACLVVTIAMLIAAIALAQRGFARDLIELRELFFFVPLYLVRKAPIYLRFLLHRQVEWVRTKRNVG